MDPMENQPAAEPSPEVEGPPPPPAPEKLSRHDGFWEAVRSLAGVLALVLLTRTFIAEATVIPTESMENTILVGDHVFLNKILYGPRLPYTSCRVPPFKSVKRQEIVAFHYPLNPSVMFIKRAIGLGGDVVKIVNRRVSVNGKPLEEPYAQFEYSRLNPLYDNFPPPLNEIPTLPAAWGLDPSWARGMARFIEKDGLHVPPGYIFVMGDNRDNSLDSRFWGFVPEDAVVGEPLFVYWSYDAPTRDWTAEEIRDRVRFNLSIAWNFLTKTRWSRTRKIF